VLLLDFLDLAGRECGVRQDNGVSVVARGLSHVYGELRSLDSIELEAQPGEVVAFVGPSGCGKSTLLEIACGLREPSAGTIVVEGAADAAGRLSHCAYMPQRDLLLPWFSALDNAALALRNRGVGRAEARSRAGELFDRFGLAGFEEARPQELSGGMRQRVAFLRTLVAGKPVLLLDEPFASLDAISRAEMQEWLAGALRLDRRTVLLVSHDLEEALYLADRVLVLSARPGRVVKELRAPDPRAPDRDGAVTDPEFVAAREAALRALHAGAR
jgi:ABC-type nitrate/sulfonate/bicarbonate transport system ATPase subunit